MLDYFQIRRVEDSTTKQCSISTITFDAQRELSLSLTTLNAVLYATVQICTEDGKTIAIVVFLS